MSEHPAFASCVCGHTEEQHGPLGCTGYAEDQDGYDMGCGCEKFEADEPEKAAKPIGSQIAEAESRSTMRCPECGSADSILAVRSFGVRELECQECLASFYEDELCSR